MCWYRIFNKIGENLLDYKKVFGLHHFFRWPMVSFYGLSTLTREAVANKAFPPNIVGFLFQDNKTKGRTRFARKCGEPIRVAAVLL